MSEGDFLFDTGAQHFHDSYDGTLDAAIRAGMGDRFRIPLEPKGVYQDGRVVTFTPRSLNIASLLPWHALGPGARLDALKALARLAASYRAADIRFPGRWGPGDEEPALENIRGAAFRRIIADPVSDYAMGAGTDAISAAAFAVALRYTFFDRTGGFTGGMGSLAVALAAGADLKTGMKATEVLVERGEAVGVRAVPAGGGRARSYKADMVVCAVPAPEAGKLTSALGAEARVAIEASEHAPAIVVNIALGGEVRAPGGPVLIPGGEGLHASWVCAHTSKAGEYAPPGSMQVTAVMSGAVARSLMRSGDKEILALASEDCACALGTGGLPILHTRVDRHPLGRYVPTPGHAARVRALEEAGSGIKNLGLAGDWMMSPTVEGAVASGARAARDTLARAGH